MSLFNRSVVVPTQEEEESSDSSMESEAFDGTCGTATTAGQHRACLSNFLKEKFPQQGAEQEPDDAEDLDTDYTPAADEAAIKMEDEEDPEEDEDDDDFIDDSGDAHDPQAAAALSKMLPRMRGDTRR